VCINEQVKVLQHIYHDILRLIIESFLIIDDKFKPKALKELSLSEEFLTLKELQCRHITILNQMT